MYVSHTLLKENKVESRAYQEKIVKKALERNLLVVAPTALGKTVIAALLAAEFLKLHPSKKILFLAPTRPLAAQHAKRFNEFLNIKEEKISLLTGKNLPDKRGEIWNFSTIICATPQVIRNDFKNNRYLFHDVSLVIFDEAHRAVGNYAYNDIAAVLECRILGLTASPGSDKSTIIEVLKNLKLDGLEIRDESDPDTSPYVKGLKIEWKKVKLPEPYKVVRKLLLGLLHDRLEVLKKQGILKNSRPALTKKELLKLMRGLQSSASEGRKELYPSISAVSGAMTIAHALDLVETQGMGPLYKYLNRTADKAQKSSSSVALKKLSLTPDFKRVLLMSKNMSKKLRDPKLSALTEIISNLKRDSKIIVFTQYRDSASEIVETLNHIDGVKAVRFVGQTSKNGDQGLSQKEQLSIIESFKEGHFNVLVATSVAEEGLDIPSVELVIFFEPVTSEIRSIQRRGRTGRTEVGRVVILIAENTRDEGIYWSGVQKERRMKKSVKGLKKATTFEKKNLNGWFRK